MRRYWNYMEEVVERVLQEYMKNDHTICSCQSCFDDIAAVALNQLRPRYVTSTTGLYHVESKESQLGFATEVVRVIRKAVEKVRPNPRHDVQRSEPPPQQQPASGRRRKTVLTWRVRTSIPTPR